MENVDQQQQWEFLLAQANELYSQGDEFGDNVALSEAIVVNRKGLLLAPSSQRPLAWAATQNNLGTALQTLGAREGGTARLEEAVAAFREALKERTLSPKSSLAQTTFVPSRKAESQLPLGGTRVAPTAGPVFRGVRYRSRSCAAGHEARRRELTQNGLAPRYGCPRHSPPICRFRMFLARKGCLKATPRN
jgi:hypothetical protein